MLEMLLKSIGGVEGLLKLFNITPEEMKSHINKIVNISETVESRMIAIETKLQVIYNHLEEDI